MTTPSANKMTLTDEQAKSWVDKVIYTSDGKNVGEVGAFLRDSSGNITELHADIGGVLGIGETRVRLMPSQFQLGTDRVTVNLTESQIKALPQVTK
jgi:PRC-barrel domain